MKLKNRQDYRLRRHQRLRKKVRGTAERPRMSVFISNRHLYIQFIDDDAARTLASISTLADGKKDGRKDVNKAAELGREAAELIKAQGVKAVVFDRGGFNYEGRVRAVADAAREAGLEF